MNKNAKKDMKDYNKESLLSALSLPQITNDTLTIALVVARWIKKYSKNVLSDADLLNVLCLTKSIKTSIPTIFAFRESYTQDDEKT